MFEWCFNIIYVEALTPKTSLQNQEKLVVELNPLVAKLYMLFCPVSCCDHRWQFSTTLPEIRVGLGITGNLASPLTHDVLAVGGSIDRRCSCDSVILLDGGRGSCTLVIPLNQYPFSSRDNWILLGHRPNESSLWSTNTTMENHHFFMGKSTINGHFVYKVGPPR